VALSGGHRPELRKRQFRNVVDVLAKLANTPNIRICKKDSHLLSTVSKLRRELRSTKFNRKLRAS
jgi:hypothetical protein